VRVPDDARDHVAWDERLDTTAGWAKYNEHYWLEGGYDDFVDFFMARLVSEPHSTKQVEDAVEWAHETTPQVVADSTAARLGCDGVVCAPVEDLARQVRCPVLAIHGTDDQIRPAVVSERLVELTGGELLLLEGSGHAPMTRDPVKVNHLIGDFAERVARGTSAAYRPAPWQRARNRPRRALYLSSPIGLGHARRDLAVADELRKLHPVLEVEWMAQHPVTAMLERAGVRVHPA
jgi:hypothetical protein